MGLYARQRPLTWVVFSDRSYPNLPHPDDRLGEVEAHSREHARELARAKYGPGIVVQRPPVLTSTKKPKRPVDHARVARYHKRRRA